MFGFKLGVQTDFLCMYNILHRMYNRILLGNNLNIVEHVVHEIIFILQQFISAPPTNVHKNHI